MGVQVVEEVADLSASAGVEPGHRFVEYEDVGLHREHAGDGA